MGIEAVWIRRRYFPCFSDKYEASHSAHDKQIVWHVNHTASAAY